MSRPRRWRAFILNDLLGAPAARLSGLASALLATVESNTQALRAGQLCMNAARDKLPAQRLCRARGWVQDDDYFMFHRFPQRG